ncbi:hypothetical protein D3C72_1873360 [compost metagenome]
MDLLPDVSWHPYKSDSLSSARRPTHESNIQKQFYLWSALDANESVYNLESANTKYDDDSVR